MSVYSHLLEMKKRGEKGLFVLIDPDKEDAKSIGRRALQAQTNGAAAIFIGGSRMGNNDFGEAVREVKSAVKIPVIIFPGGSDQLSGHADAILFMSLISGRNPKYLIGEHVTAAPVVKKLGLEPIPAAYMLIESGKSTAVEIVSNTKPIPRDDVKSAARHAMAAEMLGMKLIYLEAGSGALKPVPAEMIAAARESVEIPLIVGGGIKSPAQAKEALDAGADFIVVGNALEEENDGNLLKKIAAVI
ncbi:MAG: geranylgeranylglyceryl/heptaprenylglyceryl phosphate synthase [FCB group bacterium]|nr:geranylgeranylglyceryl/heptaprenylglyceryl phosphate synthase [FCB group bacterium]